MASQKTKFSVGLFVLGGVGIALLGIIWIGMSSLFQKGDLYAAYFDESVQGLDVDSPVKYRGVSVGRVEKIGVAPDSKLIEVVLKIESGQEMGKNIVAQLKNVGITGLMFVELDRIEQDEEVVPLNLDFPSRYDPIPSKPSDIKELLQGLDDVIQQVKELKLGKIGSSLRETLGAATDVLNNVDQAIADADVKTISGGIQQTLADVNRILEPERWKRIVASVERAVGGMEGLLGDAGRTVATADDTLAHVDGIVMEKRATILKALDEFGRAMENANRFLEKGTRLAGNADDSVVHLRRYLTYTAQNLERASENLTRVTETLADQPSDLLFGGPPPRRDVEPEPGE